MEPETTQPQPQEPQKPQQESATLAPEVNQTPGKNFFSRKKLIIGSIVLLAVILAVFALIGLRSNQTATAKLPPPEPENVLLATVGDKEIRRNDVRAVALEQILASGINNEVLREYLDISIERAILDNAAAEAGLDVPQTENTNKRDYYETLKAEIVRGKVSEITAFDIGWWIPPAPEYEQRPEFTTQRADTQLAVPQIITALRSGQTPKEVVEEVIVTYPSLSPLISINGGIYQSAPDKTIFSTPRKHLYDESNLYLSFYQELYASSANSIEGHIWENGSGASVIQVIGLVEGEGIDYEQWLSQEKERLVKLNQEGINTLK